MPRVYTKKAAKNYPGDGIKKGDTYYSWEFRYGGVRRSKTPPRPSQLTQSKLGDAYAAQEAMEDAFISATCPEDIVTAMNDCAAAIRDVASEYESSMESMAVQAGPIYEEMEEKKTALESYADELESAASEVEGIDISDHIDENARPPKAAVPESFDDLSDPEKEAYLEAAREVANDVSLDV